MSDSYGNNSPLAPGVDGNMVGTARAGSNMGGTARSKRPQTLVPTPPTTSSPEGDTACALVGRGCRAGGIATHWNQPY
jgi:hypothetical protein